jgi:carboxymethylenebutenolidase
MPTKTLPIPTDDGQADAFAAYPDDGERHPGALLYSDAFGLRPVLQEMARELAGHGYYVLVPNIYYRHGPAPVAELPEHIGEEIRPAVIAKLMPLIEAHTPEVYLGLSEHDMRPEAISELNQALDAAGVGYTTEVYPGTIHGYAMSDTDAFNPSALQRHWDRLFSLLDRTLAGS